MFFTRPPVPLKMSSEMPWVIPSIEKVAIKGGTLSLETSVPFNRPGMMPMTSVQMNAARIAAAGLTPAEISPVVIFALMMLAKPKTKPTDRSIPPVIITKLSPVPSRKYVTPKKKMFCNVLKVKKPLTEKVKMINSANKKNNAHLRSIYRSVLELEIGELPLTCCSF